MNGRITIDGFYDEKEGYTIITHGDNPKQDALCSFTWLIGHNRNCMELIKLMGKEVQHNLEMEAERDEMDMLSQNINKRLVKEGMPMLTPEQLDIICTELYFQEGST